MKLNDIKTYMERNYILRKISLFLKKIGAVKLIHGLLEIFHVNENMDEIEKFSQFYSFHKDEFQKVTECLNDDFSKKTYQCLINYHLGKQRRELKKYTCFPQYFPSNIFALSTLKNNCVFLDGGAYVGDTIEEFIKFTDGQYKKILAWEPDERNICKLEKIAKRNNNIEIVKKGLWSDNNILLFSAEGTDKSSIRKEGNVEIEVSSIDKIHENEEITFIKMDIEGAEQEALKGAMWTIKKCKPILAICIYHSWEDLYKIPLWIKENFPDYNLYIRAHSDIGGEVVVYAVDNNIDIWN